MKLSSTALFLALVAPVLAKNKYEPKFSKISPDSVEIAAAAATAVSNQYSADAANIVPGCVFDRYYQIWLENTDYDKAFEQEDLAWVRSQGITLSNYWALTHPSEPNYVGAVGGDYFGINNDNFFRIPQNVSSVADLLESKGISWAEYQEHLPYTSFQGMNYSRQSDMAPDYVRKHNPLVMYDSVANSPQRLQNIKNFTEFDLDVASGRLPQWAFITPNMTNDAHDTDVEFAGKWARKFLTPLLANKEFMKNNLIILTFDENDTYKTKNNVLAVLFGAVPDELKGTVDDTYYTHYSNLATVEANWQLGHLGRGDALANPFKFVADQLDIKLVEFDTTNQYNNKSVVGYFNDDRVPITAPNASVVGVVGNTIHPEIAKVWGGSVPNVEAPKVCPRLVSSSSSSSPSATPVANVTQTPEVSTTASAFGNATVSTYTSTVIDGKYVTVYTTDCPLTHVNTRGETVVTHVQSTVTETVCPKCTKKTETGSVSESKTATIAPKPEPTKVESKVSPSPAPVESKVSPSPAPVESKVSPAPVESKASPSLAPTSTASATVHGDSTPAAKTSTVTVSQAQVPVASTPVQANGAAKIAVGAAAVVPMLLAVL